jgi:8-oxo-dGTP pyrophosphatase MutT (NUDIX family)
MKYTIVNLSSEMEKFIIDEQNNIYKLSRSSGIICKRIINGKLYFLLVKQITGKWSFPKGRKEEDEDEFTCAKREFKEEVGLSIDYIDKLKKIKIYSNTYYIMNFDTFFDNQNEISFLNTIKTIHSEEEIINNDDTNNLNNEIIDISWINISFIKNNISYFNTDIKAIVSSQRKHKFHDVILGKKITDDLYNYLRCSPIHFINTN